MTLVPERLRAWWDALATRERRMVGAMLVLVALFVLWYGLVAPLRGFAQAADARHERALATWRAAQADAAVVAAAPTGAGADAAQVLAAARDAGLAIAREQADAGVLTVRIEQAAAPAVLAWLDVLQREHGTGPLELAARRDAGALVVDASFPVATP
ncbi:type II secretion system protein GspM [Coralloluteibacterium stylophorae]|uniref:Type II secretion system protein M n=1 Tax=Coralloluteibacterium stylophorae TaxID=1776034 RepID=A0A8J8AZ77_9GAMM|nr:type II secretion system protein GspM [Coralloluteibacterium stylophorae]MBS7458930.1 type II secretion system protein M [Coralloluteibacterium stylophorae]